MHKEFTIVPLIKKSKLALLLLLFFPLTAQAEFCKQTELPNLADTMKTQDIFDPDHSHCKNHVHIVFFIWGRIGCNRDVNALLDKAVEFKNLGIRSPPNRHSAHDVMYSLAINMAYAEASLEETQQAALKACRRLEVREKKGEVIHW